MSANVICSDLLLTDLPTLQQDYLPYLKSMRMLDRGNLSTLKDLIINPFISAIDDNFRAENKKIGEKDTHDDESENIWISKIAQEQRKEKLWKAMDQGMGCSVVIGGQAPPWDPVDEEEIEDSEADSPKMEISNEDLQGALSDLSH